MLSFPSIINKCCCSYNSTLHCTCTCVTVRSLINTGPDCLLILSLTCWHEFHIVSQTWIGTLCAGGFTASYKLRLYIFSQLSVCTCSSCWPAHSFVLKLFLSSLIISGLDLYFSFWTNSVWVPLPCCNRCVSVIFTWRKLVLALDLQNNGIVVHWVQFSWNAVFLNEKLQPEGLRISLLVTGITFAPSLVRFRAHTFKHEQTRYSKWPWCKQDNQIFA